MKGMRAALDRRHLDLGPDPSFNPFEQWLDTADPGRAAIEAVIHPRYLGLEEVRHRPVRGPPWGLKNNGLREGCKTQWHQQGGDFDRQPPKRRRIQ